MRCSLPPAGGRAHRAGRRPGRGGPDRSGCGRRPPEVRPPAPAPGTPKSHRSGGLRWPRRRFSRDGARFAGAFRSGPRISGAWADGSARERGAGVRGAPVWRHGCAKSDTPHRCPTAPYVCVDMDDERAPRASRPALSAAGSVRSPAVLPDGGGGHRLGARHGAHDGAHVAVAAGAGDGGGHGVSSSVAAGLPSGGGGGGAGPDRRARPWRGPDAGAKGSWRKTPTGRGSRPSRWQASAGWRSGHRGVRSTPAPRRSDRHTVST
jgi:hypothetical protein